MAPLGRNLFRGDGLRIAARVSEIEDHEVQGRRQRGIVERREIGHLEVEVTMFHVDAAEHSVENSQRKLAAPLRNRRIAGGVGSERRRKRGLSGPLGTMTHRAVSLKYCSSGGVGGRVGLRGEAQRRP